MCIATTSNDVRNISQRKNVRGKRSGIGNRILIAVQQNPNSVTIRSAPDGHCLLHSFVSSWQSQLVSTQEDQENLLTIQKVKTLLFQEIQNNIPFYCQLNGCNEYELMRQRNNYLERKLYNSDLVDIMPLILCETFNVKIKIVCKYQGSDIPKMTCFKPMRNVDSNSINTIYLYRVPEHYDGLRFAVKTTEQSIHPVNDASRSSNCVNNLPAHSTPEQEHGCNDKALKEDSDCVVQVLHTSTLVSKDTNTDTADSNANCKITLLNVNCQSVRSKKESFLQLLDEVNPDIIVATETWTRPSDTDGEIIPVSLYNIERRDRPNDPHGGVFIAAKKGLDLIRGKTVPNCEILWCKININSSYKINVGAYYRPHSNDETSFEIMTQTFQELQKDTNQPIILAGDLNYPGVDWITRELKKDCPSSRLHKEFMEFLEANELTQLINQPTRNENILDLVITNSPDTVHGVKVIPGISDHDGCAVVEFHFPTKQVRPKYKCVQNFALADWLAFHQDLEKVKCNIISKADTATADELYSEFAEAIEEGIRKYIPTKSFRENKKLPFVTKYIRKLINTRNRLYKKLQRQRSNKCSRNDDKLEMTLGKFKELKCIVQLELRKAYWSYVERILGVTISEDSESGIQQTSNLKQFYKFIKSQRVQNSNISMLKESDCTFTSSKEKADVFNRQFTSVFTMETPFDHLNNRANFCDAMEDITFSVGGIHSLLRKIDVSKAKGPDNISPKILKELADVIAPILAIIFQVSYNSGQVPSLWKTANVVPVFKCGDKTNPANYRPISLTCICCKLMEKIVLRNILDHNNDHNILNRMQHGFRSKHSCETQLIEFTSEIINNLEKGYTTDVLVMDFSKAFDKVGHDRLLAKLNYYGIQGKTHFWIKAFLENRTQRVVVDGAFSSEAKVTSGVPQGSVLGPCLFLFYINDLPNQLSSTVRLFADDTIVYRTIHNSDDETKLQEDLDKLAEWEKNWQMEFNPDKCKVLRIAKSKMQNLNLNTHYNLHGKSLEMAKEVKYLGLTITSDFSWNAHISNINSKANRTLGLLKRTLKLRSRHLKATAFKTIVRPVIEYASSVWDPYTEDNIKKLERIQRRAARYSLCRYDRIDSVTEMLKELNWETLAERRQRSRLTMLYKMTHGLASVEHTEHLKPIQRVTKHLSENAFQVPYSKSNYGKFAFFPRTIREWNSLPKETQTATSLGCFKSRLLLNE